MSVESKPGTWVVVNFFATWCTPCQAETPQLVDFAAAHRASGDASVVSVLYADSASKASRYASLHGVTWPIVDDHDATISGRYQVTGLPQSFVVRPDGTLAARIFGAVTATKLDAVIGAQA